MSTQLEAYNYLRVEAGKPQLKSWNKSGQVLADRGIKEFSAEAWGDALVAVKPESTGPKPYSKEVKPKSAKDKATAERNGKKANGKKAAAKKTNGKTAPAKRGIGAFILEQDSKLTSAEILVLVLKAFPDAVTTVGSVSSVRSRAKK